MESLGAGGISLRQTGMVWDTRGGDRGSFIGSQNSNFGLPKIAGIAKDFKLMAAQADEVKFLDKLAASCGLLVKTGTDGQGSYKVLRPSADRTVKPEKED
jgi:hypothetical protein